MQKKVQKTCMNEEIKYLYKHPHMIDHNIGIGTTQKENTTIIIFTLIDKQIFYVINVL